MFFERNWRKQENWISSENKLKTLKTSNNFVENPEYTETKEKLDNIFQEKNDIRIRSKWYWYKHGKIFKIFKSSKFSLNLWKSCVVQNEFRNILIVNKGLNYHEGISNELCLFYKKLFSEKQHLSKEDMNQYVNTISKFPKLSNEHLLECEKYITEKELLEALKSMLYKKSLGMMILLKNILKNFGLR